MNNLKSLNIIVLIQLFSLTSLLGQTPTAPATNLNAVATEGDRLYVSFTQGDGDRRIVIAKANTPVTAIPVDGIDYSGSSTFGSGNEIAPGEFVVYDNAASGVTVQGLTSGITYHFAVFEYNGSGASTAYLTNNFLVGSGSPFDAPDTPSTMLVASGLTGHSARLDWTSGSGAKRLFVLKEGSPVSSNPVDLSAYYASSNFGNGQDLGGGNYACYKGGGDYTIIQNLQPNTAYHVAIFEYNGNNAPIYLVPAATFQFQTLAYPTLTASGANYNAQGNQSTISFTRGNGARRMIVVKEASPVTFVPVDGQSYTADDDLGIGQEVAASEFVVADFTSTSITVRSLEHSTTYHYRIIEYNGTNGNNTFYHTSYLDGQFTTVAPPTTLSSDITFPNSTGNSTGISWTSGDGDRRLVVVKEGGAVDIVPPNYIVPYTNSNFNTASDMGNGNKAIYKGTGSSTVVNNLSPNTTYHIAIFEYNGVYSAVYNTTPARASFTTTGAPSQAASNINFINIEGDRMGVYWTVGNGNRRMVIVKAGSSVSAAPVDHQMYTANNSFGIGEEIAPGEFVVYDGAANNFTLRNLQVGTMYHFKVIEYNEDGPLRFYQSSADLQGSQSTMSAPTVQVSNFAVSQIEPISAQFDFDAGDGDRRMLVVRESSSPQIEPVDLENYSSSPDFNSSINSIGSNNKCIYFNTGTSASVTNLSPGSDYVVDAYEFNGFGNPVYLRPATSVVFSTPLTPSVQASNIVATAQATNMHINFTKGNGSKRLVVLKKNSALSGVPIDDHTYTASTEFGLGEVLELDAYAVYYGTGNSVSVTGLEIGTVYHISIFEAGDNGTNINYLSPAATTTVSTVAAPTLIPSSLFLNNVTNFTANVSWTNGNGTYRILVLSEGDDLSELPVQGVFYNASLNYGSGASIGNGSVVYIGSSSSANVSGLLEGTTYYINVFEFNGSLSAPAFNLTSLKGTLTTAGPPLVPASNLLVSAPSAAALQLSWTNGSGQKRLVVAKQGAPVDAVPVDGVDYMYNSAWAVGDDLGNGNYVVYDGSASEVLVTGLSDNTTYHFAVYEYNFSGAATRYLTVNPAIGLQLTPLPVELLYFKGVVRNDAVVLQWASMQEKNNDYYLMERSSDGQTFEKISIIKANNEASFYEYVDEGSLNAVNYYKLRQVDFDGNESFLKTIVVQFKADDEVRVYPNPVSSLLLVDTQSRQKNEYKIMDASGRVYSKGFVEKDINVSNLPQGQYYLYLGGKSYGFIKK